jgi:predicted dehydrogenase
VSRADALVVGLGSIGERHARLLREMGRSVATVSRRGCGDFERLPQALRVCEPSYVVVANETAQHAETVDELVAAGFRGRVLVEKPLFGAPAAIPPNAFAALFVAYNLRFHPVLLRIRELLADQVVLEVCAYVGQYLPDWRPGRDHRATASAMAGGGVLRDLSHELDYLLSIFGPWRRSTAIAVRTEALGIETEDIAAILLECARCPAISLHLNYHHRPAMRMLIINTRAHTFVADLVGNTVTVDGVAQHFDTIRDDTYRTMHAAVLGGEQGVCSAQEGLAVVELIEAIECAVKTGGWVTR